MSVGLFAQKENKYIRKGNKLYTEENYKDAEVDYMKALEANPGSNKGQFNLGDALYKQESYEDAAKIFNNQAELLSDKSERSEAYYNLGNSLLKAQKYPESIEAYKKALRNNPKNMDAKYNM
jgi:tetratricopeptide (TPR) repeat protein